jgi:hypothetical protein
MYQLAKQRASITAGLRKEKLPTYFSPPLPDTTVLAAHLRQLVAYSARQAIFKLNSP